MSCISVQKKIVYISMVNDIIKHQRLNVRYAGSLCALYFSSFSSSHSFFFLFKFIVSNCVYGDRIGVRWMWVNAFHVQLNGFQINWYFNLFEKVSAIQTGQENGGVRLKHKRSSSKSCSSQWQKTKDILENNTKWMRKKNRRENFMLYHHCVWARH